MRFLFLTILLLSIFSPEQVVSQIMTRKLEWQPNLKDEIYGEKNEFLYFFGCHYQSVTNLPYDHVKIPLPVGITAESVILKPLSSENTSTEQNNVLNTIFYNESDYTVKWSVAYERKRPVLEISVFPVRRISGTNQYERLTSYELTYTTTQAKQKLQREYAANSVLATGKWKKMKISQSGFYKITYSQLVALGFSQPSNIRIYGNGGRRLPVMNDDASADDLIENAVYFEKGSDGIFNDGDYVYFYAHGPVRWQYINKVTDSLYKTFSHRIHPYTDYSYYFITETEQPGLRPETEAQSSLPATHQATTYNYYTYYEADQTNLIKSGQLFVGEHFNILLSYDFSFYIPDISPSDTIWLIPNVITRSSAANTWTFKVNNSTVATIQGGTVQFINTATYATDIARKFSFMTANPSLNVNVAFAKPNSSAEGWLNYIGINAICNLKFNGGQMAFRNKKTEGPGNITEFTLENAGSSVKIWDVTDSVRPRIIDVTYENQKIKFTVATDSLREFVAFDGTSFLTPLAFSDVANQNLHALQNIDMVIVTHPLFRSYADELAQMHRDFDHLTVAVVEPELIYNEFSSGMPDATAIRNLMRMLHDRAPDSASMPKYLLLMGDGSYNNKGSFSGNTNFIPTYQSENSLTPTMSFVTDDFFGMLDEGEGGSKGYLDIGVGRFPVKNSGEVAGIINKIKNYITHRSYGDWKNVITFVADDEDTNLHISQADAMSVKTDTVQPVYNIDKIYLDSYKQVSTPNGARYPDVNTAINNRVNKGCIIFNYTGHGNEVNLAHEHVVGISDINSWTNFNHLPLFITATCEFSRWDDYTRTTAGESILLNPLGGSVALFSTTRLVYAQQNFALNQQIFNNIFKKHVNGEQYAFGDIIRYAKNVGSATETNKRNFSLLGDPALKPAYPMLDVVSDSINGYAAGSFADTLKALQKVTIKGHVESNGVIQTGFNGIVYPTVFDKKRLYYTLANDGGNVFNYRLQNNIIYKGKATVTNGHFVFSFYIPRDISYVIDYGKISYYSDNATDTDAHGFDKVLIGGISPDNTCDETGPSIRIFLNDENFVNGSIINQSPLLIAVVSDSLGINTVGNGIGHDLTAIIDNNTAQAIILNDYYEADLDSYNSGRVEYPLSNLSPGIHTLTVKCWDVCNNSAEATIDFIVAESSELVIDHVLNYPNPFTTQTAFYFNHNQPNVPLDVMVQIFTVTGKIVRTLEQQITTASYLSSPVYWDGKDDFGDDIGKGVYIYKMKVRAPNGNRVEKIEKLVILK